MERKGIEYWIVQTANPIGFRWFAKLDDETTKTGVSSSKGNAIFNAVRAIDKALEARQARARVRPSSDDETRLSCLDRGVRSLFRPVSRRELT
jgi:hypothetical protein